MRPHHIDETGTLTPNLACELFVHRHPVSENRGWQLIWAVPGESIYCGAYGACSEPFLRTRREAIAHGERHLGELAKPYR
jgi:hypothetical protein